MGGSFHGFESFDAVQGKQASQLDVQLLQFCLYIYIYGDDAVLDACYVRLLTFLGLVFTLYFFYFSMINRFLLVYVIGYMFFVINTTDSKGGIFHSYFILMKKVLILLTGKDLIT